jgi:hypothetical protein
MTDTVDSQLKGFMAVVKQQTKNLHEELSCELQVTQQHKGATRYKLDDTHRESEMQLAVCDTKSLNKI